MISRDGSNVQEKVFAGLLGLASMLAIPASAIDAPTVPSAKPPSLESTIDGDALSRIESDIRSTNFERRQNAMLRLWGDRETYRRWVEDAAGDPDPEIARRAVWVLDRWRRGLLPDTPPDIAQRLESASGPDTVEQLLNVGLFDGALVAIDEAVGGTNPAILDRAKSAMRRRFQFYVRSAHDRDRLPVLVEILDRLADDAQTTLAHQQLRQALTGDDEVTLPSASARWQRADKDRIEVSLHAAMGDLKRATQIADKAGEPGLIFVCRMLASDWATMAQEHKDAGTAATPDSPEYYRQWMYALIAASRCDDEEIRSLAIAKLVEPRSGPKDSDPTDGINRLRWQSLAMHGEIDAAVKILKPQQADDAAELLSQASRFADAFAVVDVDIDAIDSQVQQLVIDAIRGERSGGRAIAERGSSALMRLLTVARLLVAVGREELAFSSLLEVVNHPSLAKLDSTSSTRIEMVRMLARINRDAWIAPIIVGAEETMLSARTQFFVSIALDADNQTVASLVAALNVMRPQQSFTKRLSDAIKFLAGEVPDWFDPKIDYERLYQTLRNPDPFDAETPGLILDYARLFELHDQNELANRTVLDLANAGDLDAKLRLAETELTGGSVEVARQIFESVWKAIEISGQQSLRLNLSEDDGLMALKAVHGEAIAARRLGDIDGAESLDRLITLMAYTPSMNLRNSFAEFLVEQQFNERGIEIYEPLMRLVAFGSNDSLEFHTVARNYDAAAADINALDAAKALDMAIAGTIETTVFYPAAYVSLPAFVHRQRAGHFIKQNDEVATRREIKKLERLDAIDIDFSEKAVKAMRAGGMNELADEIIERTYEGGRDHLKQFPLDVGMANNVSWVMALSNYRLDDALAFSSRAVFYEPDSTIYRDTLAEILFRQGRREEAIALEKACLLDDPGEWHVHEQIKRFTEADDESEDAKD